MESTAKVGQIKRWTRRLRVLGNVTALPGFIDWRVLIADIQDALAGCQQSMVADLLNVPRSTLSRWANGGEPLWSHGDALLMFHRRACGAEKTQKRLVEFRERATKHPS